MVVHVFGAVSSPSSCIYALKKTEEDFGNRFPTVAAAVHNKIYVDNYLDSTETEDEVIEKIHPSSIPCLELQGAVLGVRLCPSRTRYLLDIL